MKKTIFIMTIAAGVLVAGCKQEPKEYVYLGQLYNTWGHAGQEKIKGKVKEFKQTNFWAAEENGKVVKGKVLTIEDRKSLANMGGDFTEEYNESGTVLRSTSYDENGKVLQDIKVETEGKLIIKSSYIYNDTVMGYGKYKYEGERPVLLTGYNAKNDTVTTSISYEYDQNGYIIKTQSFNYKGEPQGYTILTRNENGQVVKVQGYTKDGKLNSQTDYTYNDKSERITQHQQIFTTKVVIDYTFTYEYDKMGNYTAIIFQKDGKPLVYRAREIKYYD